MGIEESIHKLTDAINNLAVIMSGTGSVPRPTVAAGTAQVPSGGRPNYAAMTRGVLVQVAEKRGIEVPKGVRDSTIIKKLEAMDEADTILASRGGAAPGNKPDPLDAQTGDDLDTGEPDPLDAQAGAGGPEEDPFGDSAPPEPEIAYTQNDVIKAAQACAQKYGGNDAVIKVLQSVAKVSKIKDVPAEKYGDLVKAFDAPAGDIDG